MLHVFDDCRGSGSLPVGSVDGIEPAIKFAQKITSAKFRSASASSSGARDLDNLKGSQTYHRDSQKSLLRRAKFLVNMDDVDENCGLFTFLPADVSQRVSESTGSMKEQGRVSDEKVYRVAKPSDNISLIGPAGTGAVVDSSCCFYYGVRVKSGERLLLQFHFLRHADAVHGDP